MHDEPPKSRVGALIGSPARALILTELFDGRALTATELASVANDSPATASEHLGLLLSGELVTREKSGRHSYHRLASPEIAHALQQLAMQTASISPRSEIHAQNPIANPECPNVQRSHCRAFGGFDCGCFGEKGCLDRSGHGL